MEQNLTREKEKIRQHNLSKQKKEQKNGQQKLLRKIKNNIVEGVNIDIGSAKTGDVFHLCLGNVVSENMTINNIYQNKGSNSDEKKKLIEDISNLVKNRGAECNIHYDVQDLSKTIQNQIHNKKDKKKKHKFICLYNMPKQESNIMHSNNTNSKNISVRTVSVDQNMVEKIANNVKELKETHAIAIDGNWLPKPDIFNSNRTTINLADIDRLDIFNKDQDRAKKIVENVVSNVSDSTTIIKKITIASHCKGNYAAYKLLEQLIEKKELNNANFIWQIKKPSTNSSSYFGLMQKGLDKKLDTFLNNLNSNKKLSIQLDIDKQDLLHRNYSYKKMLDILNNNFDKLYELTIKDESGNRTEIKTKDALKNYINNYKPKSLLQTALPSCCLNVYKKII